MCEVAGRLSPQAAPISSRSRSAAAASCSAACRASRRAGSSSSAAAIVGYNAAIIALGLGAEVTILDRSLDRMRHLDEILSGRVTLLMSRRLEIADVRRDADLVIGAVLVPGALAPQLVTREMLA